MTQLRFACLLLIFGALSWVGRLGIDLAGGDADAGLGNLLLWIGAVLITLGAALAAFSSVAHAPIWLQLVVGLCGPLALWMVLLAGNDMFNDQATAGGIFGVGLAIFSLVWFVRARPEVKHKGSHAR